MPKCALLHNHMCVGVDNMWRICCKFKGQPRPYADTVNFDQFKSSSQYKQVVNTMETDWHPGCSICKDVEEDGRRESLRQYSNRMFSFNEGLESIEISLSNECNLKCRMCGPKYSTKWVDLIDKNHNLLEMQSFDRYDHHVQRKELSFEQLIGNTDLSNVKEIKYLGGEPFVSNKINKFFEILDQKSNIENITFHTNSNCTHFPYKQIEFLKRFKHVIITLSIDGYGKLNDYIRDGKQWSTIHSNVIKWRKFRDDNKNIHLLITPSVQAYNIHDLENLKLFADNNQIKFKLQYVYEPEFFSLNTLPPEYLNQHINDINKVDIEKASFNPLLWEQFKKYTLMFDKAVGKNIVDFIPNLYGLFNVR